MPWLSAAAPGNGGTFRSSPRVLLKNGARGIRSVATFLPARLRGFFADLGPGLITGAADDDPSGISTYSVTGAAFGYAQLWTALFSFPLMVAVQLMCSRLGMVTGRGLAGVIRRRYRRRVLWTACALLAVANVFNIGADLGGMAEATEMVTGIDSRILVPAYAALIVSLLFWSSYRRIARVFKWLTLVLFAYVGAGILAAPDWHAIVRATLVPHVEPTAGYIATFVGIARRSPPTSSSGRQGRRSRRSGCAGGAALQSARARPTSSFGARGWTCSPACSSRTSSCTSSSSPPRSPSTATAW